MRSSRTKTPTIRGALLAAAIGLLGWAFLIFAVGLALGDVGIAPIAVSLSVVAVASLASLALSVLGLVRSDGSGQKILSGWALLVGGVLGLVLLVLLLSIDW